MTVVHAVAPFFIYTELDNYIADIRGAGIITDRPELIPRKSPENIGAITTYDAEIGPGAPQTSVPSRYRDTA